MAGESKHIGWQQILFSLTTWWRHWLHHGQNIRFCNSGYGNGLLFHMTQPTSRRIIKAIACSKPTISEHYSKWKHNGTIVDRCKQREALCRIGLAKDRGGHLVNQPRLSHFDKCWETTVRHQISIMKRNIKTKKTNERRT